MQQRDDQRRSCCKVGNSEIEVGIPGSFGSIDPVLTREPARLLCWKEGEQAQRFQTKSANLFFIRCNSRLGFKPTTKYVHAFGVFGGRHARLMLAVTPFFCRVKSQDIGNEFIPPLTWDDLDHLLDIRFINETR